MQQYRTMEDVARFIEHTSSTLFGETPLHPLTSSTAMSPG